MPKADPIWVSASELARRIGCGRKSITPWVSNGMPGPNAQGKFDLEACTRWIMDNAQRSGVIEREKLGHATGQLRARYYLRRCEKIEHELQVARGHYIEATIVREGLARNINAAKQVLYTIPSRMEALFGVEAAKINREAIDDALTKLSNGEQ